MTTIKAIDDPWTLNKQLVIRPKTNILGLNELVELFEKKIGHHLEKNSPLKLNGKLNGLQKITWL
jgi:hypothetical protein